MAKIKEMFGEEGFLKRSFFAKHMKITAQAFHNKMNPKRGYERFTPEQIELMAKLLKKCKEHLETIINEGLEN